jgi:NO-binding membrane sensor protein with MHYT domain
MITHSHNTSLMLVAVVVSVVAAFTGLALIRKIGTLPDWTRKTLVSMAALVIGGGIWTMHFVAMLANEFSIPVGYDVVRTLISGLVSILVVGIALLLLHYKARTPPVMNLAALILGAGIVSMHYIGMSAMRGAVPQYSFYSIVIAMVAAAVFCLCTIRVAYGKRTKRNTVVGGLLLGLSVVVVHYTAMLDIQYLSSDGHDNGTIAMANSTLAIILVIAVFIICGSFLLVSATFLTSAERSIGTQIAQTQPDSQPTGATAPSVRSPEREGATGQAELDRADELNAIKTESTAGFSTPNSLMTGEVNTNSGETDLRIPYERNKKVSFVDYKEVGAIRADGRYTHLYTKQGIYFCPWSITEAENRLTGTPFYRAHRSYLVNIERMTSYEKRKDSGVCLFEGYDQLSKVPVSRTRVAGLMELLGLA